MQVIESKDNQFVKLARSLQKKKARKDSGLFLAEGMRLTEEVAAARCCEFALFAAESLLDARMSALAQRLEGDSVRCLSMPAALLSQIASTEHPQGVLAAVRQQELPVRTGAAFYAYADNIADPGNLGTIIRSAHAAGCGGLYLSPDTADEYNPKTVRASMGAIFKLPLCRCATPTQALAKMKPLHARLLTAAADGCDIRSCEALLREPHVWILGAEADGVSKFWREHADASVSLPMVTDAESLNVASAAAVLFYQSYFAADANIL